MKINNKIIWLYGFSCAGKTTIANEFVKLLRNENINIIKLEGEDLRKMFYPNLKYSSKDRDKVMNGLHNLSNLISKNNIHSIVCTVTPPIDYNSNIIKVHIKCPIETCIKRDVKGLYKKAENGLMNNIYGLDLEYPKLYDNDIVLDTEIYTIYECVNKLYKETIDNGKRL